MKSPFIILCALFSLSSLFAQGIAFEKMKWEEALAFAKKENKLIFVDAYTTWCAPCKQMDKRIFPSKKLGSYFNENFINLKLNMEKEEGLSVKKEYEVGVFPTFLFVSSDGTLIHRKVGYLGVKELLEEAEIANDPKLNLAAQNEKYEQGENDEDFLKKFLYTKFDARDGSHLPVLEKYLKTQDDWSTEENMKIIYEMTEDVDSPSFKYLTDHKKAFADTFGESQVSNQIQNLVFGKIQGSPDLKLGSIHDLFKIAYPGDADKRFSQYKMTHFRQKGDRAGYADAAMAHYNKYKSTDPGELNEVAFTLNRVVEEKDKLKYACKLVKQSIKLEKAHYNLETLAAITNKMGKHKKALRIADQAITIAKENNVDYSSTEALINTINQERKEASK